MANHLAVVLNTFGKVTLSTGLLPAMFWLIGLGVVGTTYMIKNRQLPAQPFISSPGKL